MLFRREHLDRFIWSTSRQEDIRRTARLPTMSGDTRPKILELRGGIGGPSALSLRGTTKHARECDQDTGADEASDQVTKPAA